MCEKQPIIVNNDDFLDFVTLLKEWKVIPFDEFHRLVSFDEEKKKPILQLYRRLCGRPVEADFSFFVPLDAREVEGFIKTFDLYLEKGEPAIGDVEFVNPSSIEIIPREFVLKKDIARIEKEHPEYRDPFFVKPDTYTPAVPDITQQAKNLSTRERHNLLRIIGALINSRDIKASQIKRQMKIAGYGDMSENTIRNYLKELPDVIEEKT